MWILVVLAFVFAVIGIANLVNGKILAGGLWLVAACLVGPGGVSIFS